MRRPMRATAAPGGKDGEELPPTLPRVAEPADVPDRDFWEVWTASNPSAGEAQLTVAG